MTRKSEKEERTAGTKEFEKGERTVRKGLEIQRAERANRLKGTRESEKKTLKNRRQRSDPVERDWRI